MPQQGGVVIPIPALAEQRELVRASIADVPSEQFLAANVALGPALELLRHERYRGCGCMTAAYEPCALHGWPPGLLRLTS